MKDTGKYSPVVLFIMLYKIVLTFESVDEILNCDMDLHQKHISFHARTGSETSAKKTNIFPLNIFQLKRTD